MKGNGKPVLAGAAGRYREFPAPAAVRAHFLVGWTNEFGADLGEPVAVVPDGCVDLLWVEGRLVVAGPDVSASIEALRPGSTVVGLRFRPGAAARWLRVPLVEIVGTRLELREFWGPEADELARRVGDAKTSNEALERLEVGLGHRAPAVEGPARDMELLFRMIGQRADRPRIVPLLDRLDMAGRTLRRRCREAFGYGPKTLHRIMRFQRFLALARRGGASNLSLLASEAGYADQAHLTREARRMAGLSPRAVLRQVAG